MAAMELIVLAFILLTFCSVLGYYIYRIAQNDWVIDLKRWNLFAQFRQGRRDSDNDDR